jgi:transcriptional regulator with XRE-family HTH domain
MVPAPPIRRRLVGKALRRHRESSGYTLTDAARILECDPSKVSRIETGQRGIRSKELRELLDEYGISAAMQAVLADLADPRSAFGWHRDYADVLPGAWRDYLILEGAASQIQGYEAQQIPGLLQTRAYARALTKTDPGFKDDTARDRAADAVMTRQLAVLEAERRPGIHLIIGEAALHQQVGGSEVMHQQLRQVARVAGDSGAVTMQILPFESGAHAAAGDGSLALLHVTEALGLGVVHLGGVGGGVCVEGADDLGAYAEVFDQLRAFALSPAQSALLLRGLVGN